MIGAVAIYKLWLTDSLLKPLIRFKVERGVSRALKSSRQLTCLNRNRNRVSSNASKNERPPVLPCLSRRTHASQSAIGGQFKPILNRINKSEVSRVSIASLTFNCNLTFSPSRLELANSLQLLPRHVTRGRNVKAKSRNTWNLYSSIWFLARNWRDKRIVLTIGRKKREMKRDNCKVT